MITKPRFANETEEADWYAANPDYILQQLERAEFEGRLTHGTVSKQLKSRDAAQASTPFLLSDDDLRLATLQAKTKGVEVHTYIESLLHAALLSASQH